MSVHCTAAGRAPAGWPALAGLSVLLLALGACNGERRAPPAPDSGALKLEQAYTSQKLAAGARADYRFRAAQRGAYLIMVYGNPEPLQITLKHPTRTCRLLGNGSCELASGEDEAYEFSVVSDGEQAVVFSLMVTHSEGRGRFEGDVARPVDLDGGEEHAGTVGVHESSYYSFATERPGVYTIALTGTQSDLLWRLFDAPVFDVILQECDAYLGAADETCQTIPLGADHRYYVKVEEKSGVPGPFRLTVYQP